ncbi:hypothetical protein [Planococcus koreensis]|uniref:hypothetical protein n=1 Tax=Planococcus koreensis TaxID=112331 RepID=UPI0039FBA80A
MLDELDGYLEIERFFTGKKLKEHARMVHEIYLIKLMFFHYQVANSRLAGKDAMLAKLKKDFYQGLEETGSWLSWEASMKVFLFKLSPSWYYSAREATERLRRMKKLQLRRL